MAWLNGSEKPQSNTVKSETSVLVPLSEFLEAILVAFVALLFSGGASTDDSDLS